MKLTLREAIVFSTLGTLMVVSDFLMEVLPNIHLVGVLLVTYTAVYRQKALYPLTVYVLLTGALNGFALWWVPYLYVWHVLGGMAMLVARWLPKAVAPVAYIVVCGLHGLLFGVLYAPAQALLFGLDFNGMVAWIIAGFPFDVIHGISNFCCGLLIPPLAMALKNAEKYARYR